MAAPLRIGVVGAGVVGLSCGLALARRGHRVTLFDPEPPGTQTSFGNAGLIATSFVVPLVLPGFWLQVPGMLMDPLGPLAIKARHLPRLAPWLIRLGIASTQTNVGHIAATLAPMVARSIDSWHAVLGRSTPLLRKDGMLLVYHSAARLAGAEAEIAIQRRNGVKVEPVRAEEIPQLEPALARGLAGGYFYPDVSHCVNPLALSQHLAAEIAVAGGTIQRARVEQITVDGEGRPLFATEGGEVAFDRAVLAAGVWSKTLLKGLGVSVPLESERGYHLMLPKPAISLRRPVRHGDNRFMLTPLDGGLRLAGTAEFASLHAPPDWRRADVFLEPAKRLLPGLDATDSRRWMGHRPSTPDSLPVIGPLPRARNIICAFGHAHLGLTLGAITAEYVAGLIEGSGGPEPGLGIERF